MVGLSPLGNLTFSHDALQHKTGEIVENFKTWDVTYTAKLVSHSNINVALLHELIDKAMRSEAGDIGYLVGNSETKLDQTGGVEE